MKKLIEEYQKIIYEDKETLQNIKNTYKNMIPVIGPIPDRTFFYIYNKQFNKRI